MTQPRRSSRPIMALLELLGRRWTLRILWELREAPLTFRALQSACGDISPTVVNTRVKELTTARLVAATGEGYALTIEGRELFALLAPLNEWAKRWAAPEPAEKPPGKISRAARRRAGG